MTEKTENQLVKSISIYALCVVSSVLMLLAGSLPITSPDVPPTGAKLELLMALFGLGCYCLGRLWRGPSK